ncbi:gluconate 2-dehydrogenase subunit 3 family protein [Algoriphagus sp. PAP.12]|uniref:gluconate 2-dehydrogenase subunit 3 family protein n=1 Tax=Algoriphagus sp. PAP.12 TaxID=2996678 RepID=UPI00227A002C|nr:gluconate 2-dehydrogenase subunit 3 family protein [Algoriphagus sp. PAP.12]
MDRRKSLKILGGVGVGIAGLAIADWKWHFADQLTHEGFFSWKEEELISAIADTIIPKGLPANTPSPDSKPIGALSTGTDKFLIRLFEHCYEKEDQDLIKTQLKELGKTNFLNSDQKGREEILVAMSNSENKDEKKFFDLMKSQTIFGFTTVKEVMVDYYGYKVAPGKYEGCVTIA